MSGVLHPVGPEPSGTYWARRFLVAAMAVLVVLGLVVVTTAGNGRATVTANPAPAVPATASPTPTATQATAATQAEPQSTSEPRRQATAQPKATAQAKATDQAKAKARATPSRTAGPTAKAAPTPSIAPKRSTSASPKATPTRPSSRATSAAPKAKVGQPVRPRVPPCPAADLRATLTGKRALAAKQATWFHLSLINGSRATCRVRVTPDNFDLTIHSGTDRIWSTKDCSRAITIINHPVRSEEAVEWRQRWDGLRSQKNCRDRAETPRPGSYLATARLTGAKPVQLRMILR